MKIWHISDTHSYHSLLKVPENIDLVIFSGDESNYYESWKNEPECRDFINWFSGLSIKYKVMIAGNHSSYINKNGREFRQLCLDKNIIYLENEGVEIETFKIWGSPFSPTFGNWYFMKDRSKMDNLWQNIPEDTDILITHTPPKGILDLSYNRQHSLEACGCRSLMSHIMRVKPLLACFGHIHNSEDMVNAGTRVLPELRTIFSNGSVVTDGKFGRVTSNGNIFEL